MLNLKFLADLAEEHRADLDHPVREFDLAGRPFAFKTRPALMGVVNLSPDSWYRESVCLSTGSAIARALVLAAQGADVIDVGAESSLSHATLVEADQQLKRLLPVIRELSRSDLIVSVETYHASVATTCLEAGARIVNLTGAPDSPDLFRAVADAEAAVILCHVQGQNVRAVGDYPLDSDPIGVMAAAFAPQIGAAEQAGVTRIFVDPGLGFYYDNLNDSALRVRHQMNVFLNSFRLRRFGWPICHALPHAFDFFGEEVRTAEGFFAVLAALGQTSLFRTHEVAKVRAVLETLALL